MAAIASRWFRRKASQRLPRSGPLGARFIQREMVLSESSKPSMRSSPWIRGAPHVGFSTNMRKINSRTSFGVGLLPTRLWTLEISRQCVQKTSPVPADDGFGRHDEEGLLPSRADPPSDYPEESSLCQRLRSAWSTASLSSVMSGGASCRLTSRSIRRALGSSSSCAKRFHLNPLTNT
jgi:hypothetical protein